MRNVGDHADSYATDSPSRHVQTIDRRQLEVGEWDGTTFSWLHEPDGTRHRLNIDDAFAAAEEIWRILSETKAGSAYPIFSAGALEARPPTLQVVSAATDLLPIRPPAAPTSPPRGRQKPQTQAKRTMPIPRVFVTVQVWQVVVGLARMLLCVRGSAVV